MLEASECIAIVVNGEQISLHEVLTLAKLSGRLQLFQDAIDVSLIRQEASTRGIAISSEELQQAADEFRIANELHDAPTTEQWLSANQLSYIDWESLIEARTVADKLRKELTANRTEQYFVENRLSFDSAIIYRLVVKDEEVARELRAQIVEDGADFHALARLFSIDIVTRLGGGYAGPVRRADLEPAVEAAIFGAQPQALVGPLKVDQGWELIKVESLHPATLDDGLREAISQRLFADWLGERRRKTLISLPLLAPSLAAEEDAEQDSTAKSG